MRGAVAISFLFLFVFSVFARKEKINGVTESRKSARKSQLNVGKVAKDITNNFLKLSKPNNGKPPVIDLVFALDASSDYSVEEQGKAFDYQRELVKSLLDGFSISLSGTRVSIVSCRWPYSHVNFYLTQHVNKECVMAWIPALRNEGGPKALGRCLSTIKGVFKENTGMRSNSKKVLFVVTTGKSRGEMQPEFPSKWLKKHGVEIFGLTIGHGKDGLEQLQEISSTPVEKHVFWVKELKDIRTLSTMLKNKGGYPTICHEDGTFYDECERMCSCISGRQKQCKHVRKDFSAMNKEDRTRFIKVLKIAATKEPFRSQYNDLVSTYKKFFNCVSKRTVYLPWHRAYLLKLENLLKEIDCRVTLPYWDWGRTSGNPWQVDDPISVWSKASYGLGGNGTGPNSCVHTGPFREGLWNITIDGVETTCLKRRFHDNLPDTRKIQTALSLPWQNFSQFEKMLRVRFHHSLACNNIGGHVCSQEAAKTPEFILITSFIDKLWGQWQNISDFHRDTGYPVVSNNLPGFYFSYVGDVLRLDKQPGCVNIIYDKTTRIDNKNTSTSSKGE
ncbi:hypothetical protein ACROYT_G033174 [Oculina patagonica]